MTSWRAHYAAALYATGVPLDHVAAALGGFERPVSRQRVFQLINQAGLEFRETRVDTDDIDAAFRAAQAAGLVRRADIMRAVRDALHPHRISSANISGRITALTGLKGAEYIPPPGTPEGWRYCVDCKAFAPPSSGKSRCIEHYNAYARSLSRARRARRGLRTIGDRADIRRRAMAAVAEYRRGEVQSISEACQRHQISRATFRRVALMEPTS